MKLVISAVIVMLVSGTVKVALEAGTGGPISGVVGVVSGSSIGIGGSMTGVVGGVSVSSIGTGGPITGAVMSGVTGGSMTGVSTIGGVIPGSIRLPLAPQL